MKRTTSKPAPTGAKVLPLRQIPTPIPVASPAPVDGRHQYFANTNGRRWGR